MSHTTITTMSSTFSLPRQLHHNERVPGKLPKGVRHDTIHRFTSELSFHASLEEELPRQPLLKAARSCSQDRLSVTRSIQSQQERISVRSGGYLSEDNFFRLWKRHTNHGMAYKSLKECGKRDHLRERLECKRSLRSFRTVDVVEEPFKQAQNFEFPFGHRLPHATSFVQFTHFSWDGLQGYDPSSSTFLSACSESSLKRHCSIQNLSLEKKTFSFENVSQNHAGRSEDLGTEWTEQGINEVVHNLLCNNATVTPSLISTAKNTDSINHELHVKRTLCSPEETWLDDKQAALLLPEELQPSRPKLSRALHVPNHGGNQVSCMAASQQLLISDCCEEANIDCPRAPSQQVENQPAKLFSENSVNAEGHSHSSATTATHFDFDGASSSTPSPEPSGQPCPSTEETSHPVPSTENSQAGAPRLEEMSAPAVEESIMEAFPPADNSEQVVAQLKALLKNTLTDAIRKRIIYSERFSDDDFEYRIVSLPLDHPLLLIDSDEGGLRWRLFSEQEWRLLGLQMSRGWVHCGASPNEPHVLLFRRQREGTARQGIEDEITDIEKNTQKQETSSKKATGPDMTDGKSDAETDLGSPDEDGAEKDSDSEASHWWETDDDDDEHFNCLPLSGSRGTLPRIDNLNLMNEDDGDQLDNSWAPLWNGGLSKSCTSSCHLSGNCPAVPHFDEMPKQRPTSFARLEDRLLSGTAWQGHSGGLAETGRRGLNTTAFLRCADKFTAGHGKVSGRSDPELQDTQGEVEGNSQEYLRQTSNIPHLELEENAASSLQDSSIRILAAASDSIPQWVTCGVHVLLTGTHPIIGRHFNTEATIDSIVSFHKDQPVFLTSNYGKLRGMDQRPGRLQESRLESSHSNLFLIYVSVSFDSQNHRDSSCQACHCASSRSRKGIGCSRCTCCNSSTLQNEPRLLCVPLSMLQPLTPSQNDTAIVVAESSLHRGTKGLVCSSRHNGHVMIQTLDEEIPIIVNSEDILLFDHRFSHSCH